MNAFDPRDFVARGGLMMLIAARRDVMAVGISLRIAGWVAAAIMAASVVAMALTAL